MAVPMMPLGFLFTVLLGSDTIVNKDGDFSLAVNIMRVMEGGPFVLRLTLRYSGQKPVDVFPDGPPEDCGGHEVPSASRGHVFLPKDWKEVYRVSPYYYMGGGHRGGRAASSLRLGEGWTATFFLHHDYEPIPAGKVKLRLEWPVYQPGKWIKEDGFRRLTRGDLLAKPSIMLTVDIPKVTPERLRTMARDFAAQIRKQTLSQQERQHLVNCVLHTPHNAFNSVTLQLIKLGHPVPAMDLLQTLYESPRTPRAAHALLVDYLCEEHPKEAESVFDFWSIIARQTSLRYVCDRLPTPNEIISTFLRYLSENLVWEIGPHRRLFDHLKAKKLLLPDDQFQRLCGAKNIWVKALTYTHFRKRCDPKWAADLLAELRQQIQPFPAKEFSRLLQQLDDNSFRVRQQATTALLQRGDVMVPSLTEALKKPLTLEVKKRIERILAELKDKPIDPLARRTLSHLQRQAGLVSPAAPHAREILEALAQGSPSSRISEQARAALKRIDQEKRR